MSAKQPRKLLGLGSYKSAWLLCAKLRRAMVDPDRNPLRGLVEIDEASIPHRTRDEPVAGGRGRGHTGKLLIAGAVEVQGEGEIPDRRISLVKCLGSIIGATIGVFL